MAHDERSAGFIIFRRPADPGAQTEFLLLNAGRHWDYPKGHVRKGEDDLAGATRELAEETGITDARVVEGFRHEIVYFFRLPKRGLIRKCVVFFLGETTAREVTISHEHVGAEFLPYDAALKRVTFATAKQVLRAAWERLGRADEVARGSRASSDAESQQSTGELFPGGTTS